MITILWGDNTTLHFLRVMTVFQGYGKNPVHSLLKRMAISEQHTLCNIFQSHINSSGTHSYKTSQWNCQGMQSFFKENKDSRLDANPPNVKQCTYAKLQASLQTAFPRSSFYANCFRQLICRQQCHTANHTLFNSLRRNDAYMRQSTNHPWFS